MLENVILMTVAARHNWQRVKWGHQGAFVYNHRWRGSLNLSDLKARKILHLLSGIIGTIPFVTSCNPSLLILTS
ncbi:hypothetical protein E2C01_042756 [Portunus trituberculatus]|uniref:Uncharacterized protein n=1 Tax=Portunus trituberculatus TaxID=210409 RepID=A0A5B7FVN3_PORTR|nr:hypothetical protein [Portunus trituberculatus]